MKGQVKALAFRNHKRWLVVSWWQIFVCLDAPSNANKGRYSWHLKTASLCTSHWLVGFFDASTKSVARGIQLHCERASTCLSPQTA